jgi:hypothetical protein
MINRFRIGLCFVLLLGLTAGCVHKNPSAPGTVSGKVTSGGKVVPAGNIAFHHPDKGTYRSTLDSDGTYAITDLPTGELVVTVETESVNPGKKAPTYGGDKGSKMYQERLAAEQKKGMAAARTPPQTYVKIPAKYANSKTSPLKATIVAGRQVKEFDLTD